MKEVEEFTKEQLKQITARTMKLIEENEPVRGPDIFKLPPTLLEARTARVRGYREQARQEIREQAKLERTWDASTSQSFGEFS